MKTDLATNQTGFLLKELLLDTWMRLAMGIKGNRLLKNLSFNEMVICRILYKAEQEHRKVTATDICRESRVLKSQVNKLLSDMEKKKLILRARDAEDKRCILITLSEEGKAVYLQEHDLVMEIVDEIAERLGERESKELIRKINKVIAIMDEVSDK